MKHILMGLSPRPRPQLLWQALILALTFGLVGAAGCGRDPQRAGGAPVAQQPRPTAESASLPASAEEVDDEDDDDQDEGEDDDDDEDDEGEGEDEVAVDSFGTSHRPANGEGWYTNDLEAARQRARETGKPLLLIFERRDCRHCRDFNQEYLADPDFAAVLEQPEIVVLKRFRTRADIREFGLDVTPTFVGYRVGDDGELVMTDLIRGIYEKAILAKRLRDIGAGRGRLARLLAAFDEDPTDANTVNMLLTHYLDVLPPTRRIDLLEKTIRSGLGSSRLLLRQVDVLHELWADEDATHAGALAQMMAVLPARSPKPSSDDHLQLGHAWRRLGDYEQAVPHLRLAAAGAPADCVKLVALVHALARQAEARTHLYRYATALELLHEAERALERAEELCPRDHQVAEERSWFDKRWRKLDLQTRDPLRIFLEGARSGRPAAVDPERQAASLAEAIAAEPRQPVLQIVLPEAARDPGWELAREYLDASNLVRAALAHCRVVITTRADAAPGELAWLLHQPETVTARMGRFFQDADGWFFVAEAEAGVPGFRTRVADPGRDQVARSPDGTPLVRGRVVATYAGWPDAESLAVGIVLAEQATPILTELRTQLAEADCDEPALQLLLSDTYRGLLTAEERMSALQRLLRESPTDPLTARAVAQTGIALAPEAAATLLADPALGELVNAWQLLLTDNPGPALTKLQTLVASTTEPTLLAEVTRAHLALAARTTTTRPVRARALDAAGAALDRLRELAPASPEIAPLDWRLQGLRAASR